MLADGGYGSDTQMDPMEDRRKEDSGIKNLLMQRKMSNEGPTPGQPDGGFYSGPSQTIDGPGGGAMGKSMPGGMMGSMHQRMGMMGGQGGQGGMWQMLMNLFGGQKKPSLAPPMNYGNDNRAFTVDDSVPVARYDGLVGDVPKARW